MLNRFWKYIRCLLDNAATCIVDQAGPLVEFGPRCMADNQLTVHVRDSRNGFVHQHREWVSGLLNVHSEVTGVGLPRSSASSNSRAAGPGSKASK